MAGKQNRHAWEPRLSRNDFEGGEANETGSMVAGCCCYQDLEVGRRAKVGSAMGFQYSTNGISIFEWKGIKDAQDGSKTPKLDSCSGQKAVCHRVYR